MLSVGPGEPGDIVASSLGAADGEEPAVPSDRVEIGTMKESDWKLLRKLKPVLLERLCEHNLRECRDAIAEEDGSAHERYLHLCALLRTRNDDVAICFDDHRHSNAILKVAAIYRRGLLEDEELAQFSEVTRATVRALSTPGLDQRRVR